MSTPSTKEQPYPIPSNEPSMDLPKVATMKDEFLISKDALYDYYSTNSGMFPKNPTIAGQGGGGGGDLDGRVAKLERSQEKQDETISEQGEILSSVNETVATQGDTLTKVKDAAKSNLDALIAADFPADPDEYVDIDDIISCQDALKSASENFLSAVISANS